MHHVFSTQFMSETMNMLGAGGNFKDTNILNTDIT